MQAYSLHPSIPSRYWQTTVDWCLREGSLDNRLNLPFNTVIDASYRVLRVVGSGGFGITYAAEDINLGTTVAIKEYYPADYAARDKTLSVLPRSERHKKPFEWGRSSFLQEARTLARFRHPSIVQITRVFEAYSTAYMVMIFEEGQDFGTWLEGLGRPPTQWELDRIADPLLDALRTMHAAHFLHRDIAPDNIIVRTDGTPVLLDFGAARRAVAEVSRSLTGIIKAGYSPHEQYSSDGRLQGPWSDLYALGGTFYRAVTGRSPEEATLRVDVDGMMPATKGAIGKYRPEFLSAIDACLRIKHSERPESVDQLRPLLLGEEGRAKAIPKTGVTRDKKRSTTNSMVTPRRPWKSMAAVIVLILLGGAYVGLEHTRSNVPSATRPGHSGAYPEKEGGAEPEASHERNVLREADQRQREEEDTRRRREK